MEDVSSVLADLRRITEYKSSKHDEFVITFCGVFSSGKSTIINNLLDYGAFRLPVGINPVTKLITRITYGEKIRIYYEKNHERIFMKKREFESMVSGEISPSAGCTSITIEIPALILKNGCVLIDTPGFEDEMGGELERISREAVMEADMVVMCASSSKLGDIFEKGFVKELDESVNNFCLVVNHMDLLYTLEDIRNVKKQAERMMKGKGGILPRNIFYTIAYGENKNMDGFDSFTAFIIENEITKKMISATTKSSVLEYSYKKLLDKTSRMRLEIDEELSSAAAKHESVLTDKKVDEEIRKKKKAHVTMKLINEYTARIDDKIENIKEKARHIAPSPLSEYTRQIRGILYKEFLSVSVLAEYNLPSGMSANHMSEKFKKYISQFAVPIPQERRIPKRGFLNSLIGAVSIEYNDYISELVNGIRTKLRPEFIKELEGFIKGYVNRGEQKVTMISGYEDRIEILTKQKNALDGIEAYISRELV